MMQDGQSLFGQDLNQILQHRPQSSHYLNTIPTEESNFRNCQANEVFPVWSSVAEAKLSIRTEHMAFFEMLHANQTQQMVDLVENQNARWSDH